MHLKNSLFGLLLLGISLVSPLGQAQTGATQTIAAVLYNLNHFPDEGAQNSLSQIAQDPAATEDEKSVANALAGVQHKVKSEDVAVLEAISANEAASVEIRELARILLGVHHTPAAEDLPALKSMM